MIKTAKRLMIYLGGLFIIAIGINISKNAQLGISPVSSIPYAVELIWGIELGKATMIIYIIFIAIQIALLRRNYRPIQLLQILCTYILGYFITITSTKYLLFWLPIPSNYIVKLTYLSFSIILLGIGISFFLISNFVPLPGEGMMKAIVEASGDKYKFADIKVIVDCILVFISGTMSLIFLHQLKSVREGTVLAAIFVGKVIGFIFKHYKTGIEDWFEKS